METIGRHIYNELLGLPELTEDQKKRVEEYEKQRKIETSEKAKSYWSTLFSDDQEKEKQIIVTYTHLRDRFLKTYKKIHGNPYELNDESIANLKTLLYYFCKDQRFYNSPNLLKTYKGNQLKPNFSKGLLIIGNYGNGKSSTMRTFHTVFQNINGYSFAFHNVKKLIEDFENCETPCEKKFFWHKMKGNRIYIDDVLKERQASNFGKSNLIKEIIQTRYDNQLKDYLSCNYSEGNTGNTTAALLQFYHKYGGFIFDRIFEKYNIIEFKGKSFRIIS